MQIDSREIVSATYYHCGEICVVSPILSEKKAFCCETVFPIDTAIFIISTLSFVFFTHSRNVDLVDENYYEKASSHDRVMEMKANGFLFKPEIVTDKTAQTVHSYLQKLSLKVSSVLFGHQTSSLIVLLP